jgi:hypothetical protein
VDLKCPCKELRLYMQRNFRDILSLECGDSFLFIIPKDLTNMRDIEDVVLSRYIYVYHCIHQQVINVDHGINVDQHSKPRNKSKCSILHLHLFRGLNC